MQLERRALYNSLRMNWLANSTLKVEPWQVEDYRELDLSLLFDRLKKYQIDLNKQSFQLYTENVDSPEDLTDEFLAENEMDNESQDEIYLLIFELWRRFATEKKSLSIFLDELDHQIFLYDSKKAKSEGAIQDLLEELSLLLEDNIDSGIDPHSIFETLSNSCANDLESFLYDYISQQIETEDYSYASEILDDFISYVPNTKWFEFLKAEIQAIQDPIAANQIIHKLLKESAKNDDLEFNLEIFSFIAKAGDYDTFINLVKKSLPLIKTEEDFIDLAFLSMEYFDRLDQDLHKESIKKIVDKRANIPQESYFSQKDPHIAEFLKICENHFNN